MSRTSAAGQVNTVCNMVRVVKDGVVESLYLRLTPWNALVVSAKNGYKSMQLSCMKIIAQ